LNALALCTAATIALASPMQPQVFADSTRRAALAGTVRDTAGNPLAAATVFTDGKDLSVVTDDSGRFHLRNVPVGTREFTIIRLGFEQLVFEMALPPDSTIVINVRMRRVQNLATVAVSGTAVSPRLARRGYYERKRLGLGKFVSPERIDSLQHVMTPSQLMRDVNGVMIRCRAAGRCAVLKSTGGCLNLFINGSYTRGQVDDVLSTGEVYAIEVYTRGMLVPIDFVAPRTASCSGAIVVWTRSYAP
jgi:hypothetical protein